jgi:hypothetical protein
MSIDKLRPPLERAAKSEETLGRKKLKATLPGYFSSPKRYYRPRLVRHSINIDGGALALLDPLDALLPEGRRHRRALQGYRDPGELAGPAESARLERGPVLVLVLRLLAVPVAALRVLRDVEGVALAVAEAVDHGAGETTLLLHLLDEGLGLAPVALQVLLFRHKQRVLAALEELAPVETAQVLQELGGAVGVAVVVAPQEEVDVDAGVLAGALLVQKLQLLDLELLVGGDVVLIELVLEEVALFLAGRVLFLLGDQALHFFGVDDVEDGVARGVADARTTTQLLDEEDAKG